MTIIKARIPFLSSAAYFLLAIFISMNSAFGISEITFAQMNDAQLKKYFNPELVRISITYRDRFKLSATGERIKDEYGHDIEGNENKHQYGVGFFIGEDGYVMTARHVLDVIRNKDRFRILEKKFVTLRQTSPTSFVPIELKMEDELAYYPDKPGIANPDMAVFKVSIPGVNSNNFPVLCIDTNIDVSVGHSMMIAQVTHYNSSNWPLDIIRNVDRLSNAQNSALTNHWRVQKEFLNSASGSPVLVEGRVVGLVSAGWDDALNGQPVPDGGFVYPLRADLGGAWTGYVTRCRTEQNPKYFAQMRQGDFMDGEAEGTIAWSSDRTNATYWVAREAGDYQIDWSKLKCWSPCHCNLTGDAEEKTLRLIFNHKFKPDHDAATCERDVSANDRTFYEVQVLPRFKPQFIANLEERGVSAYRSGIWYRKDSEGKFYELPAGKELRACKNNKCRVDARNVLPSEFSQEHVLGGSLDTVDQLLGFRWHGSPRSSDDAPTTFDSSSPYRLFWRDPVLAGNPESNLALGNFLIPYRGTLASSSGSPPDIEFCVGRQWKSFSLKAASPERCVEPRRISIYFYDD